jgi:A/G-specific adenine glycosylase
VHIARAPVRCVPSSGLLRRVLALLRTAATPVSVTGNAALADVEPGQLDRCLEGLLDDGLVRLASSERGTYEL